MIYRTLGVSSLLLVSLACQRDGVNTGSPRSEMDRAPSSVMAESPRPQINSERRPQTNLGTPSREDLQNEWTKLRTDLDQAIRAANDEERSLQNNPNFSRELENLRAKRTALDRQWRAAQNQNVEEFNMNARAMERELNNLRANLENFTSQYNLNTN